MTMIRHRGMVILGVLMALALSVAQAEPTTAPVAPPKVGDDAPDLSLTDLDGKKIALDDLIKKGPVVLVVLRGWPGYQCPICSRQVEELRAKAKELGERDAHVLLVYPGPSDRLDERAREFLGDDALPEGFTFATDPDYAFVNRYGLRWDAPRETAYPSTFVIGKDRIIRFAKVSKTHAGRAKAAEVIEALGAAR